MVRLFTRYVSYINLDYAKPTFDRLGSYTVEIDDEWLVRWHRVANRRSSVRYPYDKRIIGFLWE